MVGRILRLFPWFCLLLAMGCNQAPPPVARAQTQPTDDAQMQPIDDAQMQPMANAQMQPADDAQMQPMAKAQMQPPKKGTVRVRVGEHGGFDRIVFDWSSRVPYRVESKGGVVTVIFEQSATLDLSGYRKNPPPFFKSVKRRSEGEGMAVDVEIPEGTKLRHFMSGNSVVLDVLAPGTPKDAPAADAGPAKPAADQTATAPAAKPAN
jgi:hypothetical protein